MPKARMCHICGRQTLLAGYSHHIEGCAKLFLAREEQKPKKERRSLPLNPYENMTSTSGAGGGKKTAAEMNELSQQAYNGTLSECQYCGRRFLPEKLLIHNKSCRADKPARGVNDSVNRRSQNTAQMPPQSQLRTGGTHGGSDPRQQQQQQQQQLHAPYNTQSSTSPRPKSGRRMSADKIVQQYQDKQMSGYDLNAAMGGASPDIIPAEWSQCQGCGRTFNESAFAKHTKICDKVFCAKRSTFDSKKHRLNGTEAAQVSGGSKGAGKRGAGSNTRGRSDGSGGASSALNNGSMPKWKTQSSQLREAMKASRQVAMAQKEAERRGVPLASVLPPSSSPGGGASYEDPSFIRCPHCNRTFNEKAAERHIPKCKDIIAKPSFLQAHRSGGGSGGGGVKSAGGRRPIGGFRR